MNRIKQKRLKNAKDLAESIRIYLDVNNINSVYPLHLIRKFKMPIGKIRRALHMLNIEGTIAQGDRRGWRSGNIQRGAKRYWHRPK